MPKLFNVAHFNKILEECGQQLRAIKITGKEIILSNGLVLMTKKEVRLCKKRVMIGHKIWRENFDRLYGLNNIERLIVEKECRNVTSINGGINCQALYKDKIKQNLNKGIPWNKGLKGKYPYKHIHTDETKQKISAANKGLNNGMFGKKMSQEQKKYRSKIMKDKILSGEFTPNSNNRNTHWEAYYKNKKYRSSWEALYQYFNEDAEYEVLRIPYYFENKKYVYIIDFVNHKTKTLIEVKPKELISNKKVQAKINAANKWCKINGYHFILADKEYLISCEIPKNLDMFDQNTQNKIRNLYASR